VHQAWATLAPTCPQLYLYSEADALVSPASVEAFMAQQVGDGGDARGCRGRRVAGRSRAGPSLGALWACVQPWLGLDALQQVVRVRRWNGGVAAAGGSALLTGCELSLRVLQKQRGVAVSGFKWRDSAHVAHYKRHPEEYRRLVAGFAADAAAAHGGPAGKGPCASSSSVSSSSSSSASSSAGEVHS